MLNLGKDIQYNDLRTCPLIYIYIYIYSIKNNKNMFMIIYNVCQLHQKTPKTYEKSKNV